MSVLHLPKRRRAHATAAHVVALRDEPEHPEADQNDGLHSCAP